MGVEELARRALALGTQMLKDAGTPLHPFLLDQDGNAKFLVDGQGGVDPMEMALRAIQSDASKLQRCVLLVDTKLGFKDGKRWDAIVAMSCDADEDEGVVLAQRYVPKGWFRKFRLEGDVDQVAKCKNFIRVALEAQDEVVDDAARDLKTRVETLYQATHRYRNVDPVDFPHLDMAFYDTALRRLQAEGFRHLADVEDETITASGGVLDRIMLRSMASAEGDIAASAYDPKLKPEGLATLGKHPPPVLDLETEFTDGAFVVTTTAQGGASAIKLPPMVMSEFLPTHTTVAEQLSRHRQRVAAYAGVSGQAPRPVTDHQSMLASQHRLNALKAAFRNELSGITAAEIRALAGEHVQLAERMGAKLEELRGA